MILEGGFRHLNLGKTETAARKQDSLEKLVALRMNREFMQYMRKKYNHLSKQQFGQTLVQLRAKRDNNKKWEWC